jgi:hypothetical protein
MNYLDMPNKLTGKTAGRERGTSDRTADAAALHDRGRIPGRVAAEPSRGLGPMDLSYALPL